MSVHSLTRMDERLTIAEREACLTASNQFATLNRTGSHAILLATLTKIRGEIWGMDSNGNSIVAIVRDGTVTTIMLRRQSQPFTREALRVDKCWRVKA